MKHDLMLLGAGAFGGGALVLMRCRLWGAAKVLFGRAEAAAKAEVAKATGGSQPPAAGQ